MEVLESRTNVTCINAADEDAVLMFAVVFHELLREQEKDYGDIVILCIGTDRATGDSLGPIVGYKLEAMLEDAARCGEIPFVHVHVYGTLEAPVHAKNITRTLRRIKGERREPLIIAIDAALGRHEHIGCLTVGQGAIRPGAGLNKRLPHVGDIFITGIVNFTGSMDMVILQNTRLGVVMKMADAVSDGIMDGLRMFFEAERAV